MNSNEILNKIKVILGMEGITVDTIEDPKPESVEDKIEMVSDEEHAAVLAENEALKAEVAKLTEELDALKAEIARRDEKDQAIEDVVDGEEPSSEEMKKMEMAEQKLSKKPFTGAPVESAKVALTASPKSNKGDIASRVFARMNQL